MKKTVTIFITICLLLLTLPSVYAADEAVLHPPRLVDEAGVISDSEEMALNLELDLISEKNQCDVCVFITDEWLDGIAMSFADNLYDYGGYGMGENNDGVLLVISTTSRDWHITTTGYGITALTDAGLEYISEQFLPYLSDDDYESALHEYADNCDEFITRAREDKPYDVGDMPKSIMVLVFLLLGAIVAGVLIALAVVTGMKRQLKSVVSAVDATEYVKNGNFILNNRKDIFLYNNLNRIPIPKSSSGGSGGSRTHIGSSGGFHGGRGGKF